MRAEGAVLPARLISAWLLVNGLDVASTWVALGSFGMQEVNPFAKMVLERHGMAELFLLKLALVVAFVPLVAALARWRHPVIWSAVGYGAALIGAVVTFNFLQIAAELIVRIL